MDNRPTESERMFWITGLPILLPEYEPRMSRADRTIALIFAGILAGCLALVAFA